MLAFATLTSACCVNLSAQTVKARLDHVVIAVNDLETAKRLYSGLGFSMTENGHHPNGTENSTAEFTEGYLELITPFNATLPGGRRYAEYLKQGEGAKSAGLLIDSAERAARDLRAVGLKINGPAPGTIILGDEKEPPPQWWVISFSDPVPSRPLFLIQYVSPGPPERPTNPNSASSLAALLIAVNDLQRAAANYGSIAKTGNRSIPMPEFGAVAKEMILERGSIFLLAPTDPMGPTGRRLKAGGEGILGAKITVTDLGQARRRIGKRNISKNPQSILVSSEQAAGVWLQLQEMRK